MSDRNGYFFSQEGIENQANRKAIENIREISFNKKQQIYLVSSPLGDERYRPKHESSLVVLSPKHKITVLHFSENSDENEEFVEDFIEDLAAISDKFRYKEHIGRPRAWRDLIIPERWEGGREQEIIEKNAISDKAEQRRCELLISLITGSINDIEKVGVDVPETTLDLVKHRILLFDGEQTRFVYEKPATKRVVIQGLSGTGKTELLLHKLKETYLSSESNKILFTCHNRILAASLRKRIPDFFNFMKVEQQILWEERLWCVHAWGSASGKDSGAYRYICEFYNLPFYTYSRSMSFSRACSLAVDMLKGIPKSDLKFAFDSIFIDESQDFPDSFFELCEMVTRNNIYIAGDIFQSIFEIKLVDKVVPNFLLKKCYRTDPKTLMFAHGLGLGLFEERKLKWLADAEWEACGYTFEVSGGGREYVFCREPIRRFDDENIEKGLGAELVEINDVSSSFEVSVVEKIVQIVRDIKAENPTVQQDDIGVIFLDSGSSAYAMADSLAAEVYSAFGWNVNYAYSSKNKTPDMLFVSNTNNVKGLEFPFVICVSEQITAAKQYRNALYMTLTRSFLKTYLLVSKKRNEAIISSLKKGLSQINQDGVMRVSAPSRDEIEKLSTTIQVEEKRASLYEMSEEVFDELDVPPVFKASLFKLIKSTFTESYDRDSLLEFIEFNYKMLMRQKQ